MIHVYLGNVGSGKTACAVREMFLNQNQRKTYSNIKTSMDSQIDINPEMIINKKEKKTIKRKNGEIEQVYEYSLNKEFWQQINEPINVIIDEAHSIINSRRSMSKVNIIVTDWLALIRRVLGQTSAGYGTLTFITQLPNRIDNIARDMANQVRYHICHYKKVCPKCMTHWQENSEMPELIHKCPNCGCSDLVKFNHQIEVWHFKDMQYYWYWQNFGHESFHKHYIVSDIEKYFPLYNTLQWDNMFSDFY